MLSYALILIPSLLREDATAFFQKFGVKNHPQILCENAANTLIDIVNSECFKVYVDGVLVGQTDNFVVEMQLVFCTFYVFNIAYPKGLTGSLNFIQKEVLSLHDAAAPVAKVINLITKLNKSEMFNIID